jgi:magnesium-protoporphyrin IX monomethyl ester (oxidative) cyclase
MAAEKARGGIVSRVKRVGLMAGLAATFVSLYLMPTQSNALPGTVRLAPAW